MSCNFCNDYIGLNKILYSYCEFCSNLRRVLLLYGKSHLDTVLKNQLLGISIVDKAENEKVLKMVMQTDSTDNKKIDVINVDNKIINDINNSFEIKNKNKNKNHTL